jgi:hypothetical protein
VGVVDRASNATEDVGSVKSWTSVRGWNVGLPEYEAGVPAALVVSLNPEYYF